MTIPNICNTFCKKNLSFSGCKSAFTPLFLHLFAHSTHHLIIMNLFSNLALAAVMAITALMLVPAVAHSVPASIHQSEQLDHTCDPTNLDQNLRCGCFQVWAANESIAAVSQCESYFQTNLTLLQSSCDGKALNSTATTLQLILERCPLEPTPNSTVRIATYNLGGSVVRVCPICVPPVVVTLIKIVIKVIKIIIKKKKWRMSPPSNAPTERMLNFKYPADWNDIRVATLKRFNNL